MKSVFRNLRFFLLSHNRELRARLSQNVKQVACGEQYEAKGGTGKIKVVAHALLVSPIHPGKQPQCFTNVSRCDEHKTARSE